MFYVCFFRDIYFHVHFFCWNNISLITNVLSFMISFYATRFCCRCMNDGCWLVKTNPSFYLLSFEMTPKITYNLSLFFSLIFKFTNRHLDYDWWSFKWKHKINHFSNACNQHRSPWDIFSFSPIFSPLKSIISFTNSTTNRKWIYEC